MTKKHKFSHAERIAGRIAGQMTIAVRRFTHVEGISHLYWRGFRDGVRTMMKSLAEGHRIAANVRKIDRVTKLIASIDPQLIKRP